MFQNPVIHFSSSDEDKEELTVLAVNCCINLESGMALDKQT